MADAAATDQAAPEVSVEDVGPATKRLTITVGPDRVDEKLDESLGALASEAALPGFRKGKVPRRLLEKRFGPTVRQEAKNQLIADAYARAIEDQGIQPVGEPQPAEETAGLELEPGKPLTFSLEVEVVPEFELPDVVGIEVKRPLLEIDDQLVEQELGRQLLRLGASERIDGDFQAGDRIAASVSATGPDRKELLADESAVLAVPGAEADGRGPVLGIMIDDLADRLAGRVVGDTLTIETTGPEGHEVEEVRGADVVITLRILAAERPQPATVQQMMEAFGIDTEEHLREQVRLALERQRDEEQASAMRDQVRDHLLGAVDFELPERLSARQVSRNLEGLRFELLNRGLMPEEVERRLADVRGDSETQTRSRLKLFFLIHRLAEHLKIEVSEQEVNGRLAAIAAAHGQRPDMLRAELERSGRLGEIARLVREHKTIDRVIAQARVEEISAKKWNAMVQTQAAKKKKKKKKKTGG